MCKAVSKPMIATRRATDADLPQVVSINREQLPENYSIEFFKEMLDNHGDYFFVAEGRGRIIGYVMCRKETGFSPFQDYFSLSQRGHVVSLAVQQGYHRMGVGRSLMFATHESMRSSGIRESYLEVRTDNFPAIALYKTLGYEVVRTVRSYYFDGTDACLMIRKL